MKLLAVFLGFFCLLISAYPCCLVDDCNSNSEVRYAENNENPHENDCGLCSPFINCGVCVGFVSNIEEPVISLNPQLVIHSNLFGASFKSVETEYADRHWQPPQVVIIS